jgi:hypothetical protein
MKKVYGLHVHAQYGHFTKLLLCTWKASRSSNKFLKVEEELQTSSPVFTTLNFPTFISLDFSCLVFFSPVIDLHLYS